MEAVTQDEFADQVLRAEQTVVVDFWADWCGPCRMVTPVLEQLEPRHPHVRFVSVDVDDEAEIAQACQVTSIPTLLVFRHGAIQKRIVGALPSEQLLKELHAWLGDD